MQTKQSEKRNLELPTIRITATNSMSSSKHRKYFIAASLMAVFLFASAGARDANNNKPEPLMIQEQGSFAVGGSVITTPGTFDPIKQGAYNPAGADPAGQTLHGDHAYVFY
jgi:hypothetical protein